MKLASILLEEKPGGLYLTGEIPRGENKLVSTDEREREEEEEKANNKVVVHGSDEAVRCDSVVERDSVRGGAGGGRRRVPDRTHRFRHRRAQEP